MSAKNRLAHSTLANVSNNTNEPLAAFDPSWIFTIIDVINKVRPWIERCTEDGEDLKQKARRPRLFQRIMLRRYVRRALGRDKSRYYATNVCNALMKSVRESSTSDLNDILNDNS